MYKKNNFTYNCTWRFCHSKYLSNKIFSKSLKKRPVKLKAFKTFFINNFQDEGQGLT